MEACLWVKHGPDKAHKRRGCAGAGGGNPGIVIIQKLHKETLRSNAEQLRHGVDEGEGVEATHIGKDEHCVVCVWWVNGATMNGIRLSLWWQQ